MTGLDLSVDEELSSPFEPCLSVIIEVVKTNTLTLCSYLDTLYYRPVDGKILPPISPLQSHNESRKEVVFMETFDAIRTVLAVRHFKDTLVPEPIVRQIVEAGHLTASA